MHSLKPYTGKRFNIKDSRYEDFSKEAKRIHNSFHSFTPLVIPPGSGEGLLQFANYDFINEHAADLVKIHTSLPQTGDILFSLNFLSEYHFGEEHSSFPLKMKKQDEKSIMDFIGELLGLSGGKNKQSKKQEPQWRTLTLLEHVCFDYRFPMVHKHSQVLSFESLISHGVSGLRGLGFRSFKNNEGKTQLNTCFLDDEKFENVFIPLVQDNPQMGRK